MQANLQPDAANATTFDQAAQGLKIGQPGGYATDPNYIAELTKNNSLINPGSSLQSEAASAEAEITQNTQRMTQQFQSAVPQFAQLGTSASSLTGPLTSAGSGITTFGSSIEGLVKNLTGGLSGVFSGGIGFADGGLVRGPGSSKSDSIPAMLSDGEFVMNAEATRKHGALLNAINSGRVPKFAEGGYVSTKSSSAGAGGSPGAHFGDMNINITTSGSSGNHQTDQAHAQAIGKAVNDALTQRLNDWTANQLRPGGVLNTASNRRLMGQA